MRYETPEREVDPPESIGRGIPARPVVYKRPQEHRLWCNHDVDPCEPCACAKAPWWAMRSRS